MNHGMLDRDKLSVDFLHEEKILRRNRTQIALILGIMMTPAGLLLDWSTYPHQFTLLLSIRIITTLLLIGGFFYVTRLRINRDISQASLFLLMLPSFAISTMIYWTDGSLSNYFFGLILLMIFIQLLGFHLWEAIIYCALTVGCYYLAVIMNSTSSSEAYSRLVLSSFFLITTGLVSVVICQLNLRNRRTDFALRQTLDEQNRRLEQLAQQRMNFLADISHELRTPLAMILAPLDDVLEMRGRVSQSVGQSLALVRRNANRLRVLVDDLLDMARLDRGKMRLRLETVDAFEFAAQTVALAETLAKQHGVQLTIEGDSDPTDLRLDRERMERVLLNLLSNAIRYSPENSTVTLRLDVHPRVIEYHCIDHGPGIPDSLKSRVFERDFQVLATGQNNSQGLGLGLAIASEIVRWHGGDIAVADARPSPPKGCRFSVTLPHHVGFPLSDASHQDLHWTAALEKTALSERPLLERVQAVSGVPPSHSPTILCSRERAGQLELASSAHGMQHPTTAEVLIIDDEHDLRVFLTDSLKGDYATVAAATGVAGIEIALATPPQCVLLDMMLPDRDGIEVLLALRANESLRDTKIILITAHPDEAVKLRALQLGADEFLPKPFSTSELRARVASLVKSSRLQQQLRAEQESLRASLNKLRETETQLFQSEKMRAVASLAAGLLHEINNPVNFTLMATKSLRRDLQRNLDVGETIDDIQSGIERISDIVSDLRAFAYPQQAPTHASFSVKQAVETALRFARHELQDANATISADNIPEAIVVGNQVQITQVLLNLILNGLTAARQRPDRLQPQIWLTTSPFRDGRLQITVRDNGTGIPPELVQRVTEPFFTTAQQGKGLGLGLSICDTIIRSHGGQLSIESNVQVGTAISFDLPLAT